VYDAGWKYQEIEERIIYQDVFVAAFFVCNLLALLITNFMIAKTGTVAIEGNPLARILFSKVSGYGHFIFLLLLYGTLITGYLRIRKEFIYNRDEYYYLFHWLVFLMFLAGLFDLTNDFGIFLGVIL
jgi:hypothetical protein